MDVAGSVALVTGANRGFGASLCAALLERGAAKVYAGARDVSSVRDGRRRGGAARHHLGRPTSPRRSAHCGDVTLLDQQRRDRHRHVGAGRRRDGRDASASSTPTCSVRWR